MPDKSTKDNIPPGFTLRHTLRGHSSWIARIAWSPDGNTLASPSRDQTIRIWNLQTGQWVQTLVGHSQGVLCTSWSPDGRVLASCSFDKMICLWETQTWQPLRMLTGHSHYVYSVAWSPDGRVLASSSSDKTVRLWDVQTGQLLRTLTGHAGFVTSVAWSPDGRVLASSSSDKTICLWDVQTGQLLRTLTGHFWIVYSVAWSPDGLLLVSCSADQRIYLWSPHQSRILEGHTESVISVSFSYNGNLLASKSGDGTVRIWRTDTWEPLAILKESVSEDPNKRYWDPSLAFHPRAPILATLGEEDTIIRIWDLDVTTLLRAPPVTPTFHYTNAKVVIVGDSGVGKSGLGLVLTGHPFVPTDSSHGRHVWIFDDKEVELDNLRKETRQTLLWDLAGQPGYRLIHQLHLNEVAVALILFDARRETDPFAGVYHWDRALRQAQRVQGNYALPLKKFLVSARIDRGGRSVSPERIKLLVRELGFDGYFETSSKEKQGIAELAEAIKQAIDWSVLPRVTSNELFQQIKDFLLFEKEAGHLLSTSDDLYRTFLNYPNAPEESAELRAQFETCIGRVESRDLIRRLSFGNLVLLQPELLDSYASALVNAVKDEPDGLGSIAEEKARIGNFSVPRDERLKDKEQEKLLLIAMVEDLLRHEIVLREQADDGTYLVFPSQSTRENPDLPDPKGKAIIFDFEGPVQNIFATLAVRLSHSGMFKKKETWKDAVIFTSRIGGSCGMFLHNIGEGHAELTLFYGKTIGEETRFYFEEYVHRHLLRRALPDTIRRRRIYACQKCGEPLTESAVRHRREAGYDWIRCGVCDTQISILDKEEGLTPVQRSVVQEMDRSADAQRDRSAAASKLQGKIATGDFDVFLCHHGIDKSDVKKVGEKLKEQGILPWLDEWELRPGISWQRLLEERIEQIKSAAVFVGKNGIGPWQQLELEAFLREFVNRGSPVIPVLLSDTPDEPQLPLFLKGMTWVDFRKQEPDPMRQLIWGITGERERFG
ncbi:MAG: WD40 domain-containing protein [Ktedonobacteraceae bacterium]